MGEIAALLMAAGESIRMGEVKALLQWQRQTLVEYQVASLASAGISSTIVVLGYRREEIELLIKDHPTVKWVYNPDYSQGKTTSLKAGFGALKAAQVGSGLREKDAVLVLNVDQPRSGETIHRIMELHCKADASCVITIPTYEGRGGHPIILSTSLMPELMNVSEDTLGLKAVIRRHEAGTQRVEIGSSEILLDLNTPLDYQEALEASPPG